MFNNHRETSPGYEAINKFLKLIDKESYASEMEQTLDNMFLPWFDEPNKYNYYHDIYKEYLENTVVPHKVAVFEEGMKLEEYTRVRHVGDAWIRHLIYHDLSKFSIEEEAYAYYFTVDSPSSEDKPYRESKQGKMEFRSAWFHHKSSNPHHPEYWNVVERDGSSTGAMPMTRHHAIEMIADWAGASRTYGGNFKDWIKENLPQFRFHEHTIDIIATPLAEVYGIALIPSTLNIDKSKAYTFDHNC